jgi:hypothetical protein
MQDPAARPRAATILSAAVSAVAASLGMALLAVAADPPAQPISVAAPIMPPLLAAGPTPDLDLLFSAQVAGWVEPCG